MRDAERPPEPEPEPVEVGTAVWAELHSTGFYFLGVVVAREEARHRVIFTDGSTEWVEADGLRPDSLREEARVQVRPTYEGNFSEGVIARRLNEAGIHPPPFGLPPGGSAEHGLP